MKAASTETVKLTGKALLDSMFASVAASDSTSNVPVQSQQQTPMASFRFPQSLAPTNLTRAQDSRHMFMDPEILSPKPSAAALPQILSASTLHSLMGIPTDSSRSPSRTSTSTSSQAQSPYGSRTKNGNTYSPSSSGAHRSRERGYIADRGEDDGGVSEASTGIESDGQAGVIFGPPLNRGSVPHSLVSRSSFLSVTSSGGTSAGALKGDATPRARSERLDSSLPSSPPQMSHSQSRQQRPTGSQALSEQSIMTVVEGSTRKVPKQSQPKEPAQTPFRSGAEFWPHDETKSQANARRAEFVEQQDAGDVVELDFSEISVLNDPKALEARANGGALATRGKDRQISKAAAKGKQTTVTSAPKANGIGPHQRQEDGASANGLSSNEGDRRSRNKDTKKVILGVSSNIVKPNGSLTSSTASSSTPSALASPSGQNPKTQVATLVTPQLAENVLMGEVMRTDPRTREGPALEKNAFIREILTLIHTDKAFTEKLYQSYLSQSSQ